MATRTAILDVETSLNQWLEEIAKKEAPVSTVAVQRFCNSIAAIPSHPDRSQNLADCLGFLGHEIAPIRSYPIAYDRVR